MKIVKTRIRWHKLIEGKRIYPKDGYSTVAWFEEDKDNWPDEAWSLILSNINILKEDEIIVDIHFLASENAPEHLLHIGSVFKLYEGKKCVGDGEIVEKEE